MKQLCKIIGLCLVLLLGTGTAAQAASTLDPDRLGSITVHMHTGTGAGMRAVGGGTLELIPVAEVQVEDADLSYRYVEAFGGCTMPLQTASDIARAAAFQAYAEQHRLHGTAETIDSHGKAVFEKLTPGLYLVVQTRAASGYYKVNPFMVSLPMQGETANSWQYDIDASPKVEAAGKKPSGGYGGGSDTTPGSTDRVERPTQPDSTDSRPIDVTEQEVQAAEEQQPVPQMQLTRRPGVPVNEQQDRTRLPQTGAQTWLTSGMALVGMVLFSFGWLVAFGRGRG